MAKRNLAECTGCKDLGVCCRFTYSWPKPKTQIRSRVACPFLHKSGACTVYKLRHHVPWCDADAEKNKGTKDGGTFPSWCPHNTPGDDPLTYKELYARAPYSGWTTKQRQDFRDTIDHLVLTWLAASYPVGASLLDRDTLKGPGWDHDLHAGPLDPRAFGVGVGAEELDAQGKPRSDEG